jgi:hypothetical protein
LSSTESTVTRSFRISEQAFKILQEDAERQNISVNTLVNHIINYYVDFERYAKSMHIVKLPSQLLKYLLEVIQDNLIIKIGQASGENIAESFILVKFGSLSLEHVISHLRELSSYGYLFEYNEVDSPEKKTISLVHQLGYKGSLLLAHYVQSIFNRVNIHPFFNITENAVIIDIFKEQRKLL